jgi:superfamily II DNA or RNA helicase
MLTPLPPWSIDLRKWQHDGVEQWARSRPPVSLACVTPGAGKTLYAAAIAYGALASGIVEQVIAVVPSDHLRMQLALSFAGAGVQLDPMFVNAAGAIAKDLHGAVVTYHQVGADPDVFVGLLGGRSHRRSRPTLVILDEVHHAGDQERWGAGVRRAFAEARFIVALSGTPFRSDESPVAFVKYDDTGRVIADTVYSYRDALRDGIVRPLVFYRQGGEVEWSFHDGTDAPPRRRRHSFEDVLPEDMSRQRLRAALGDEEWIGATIRRAHAILESLRRHDPLAAGLVVAMSEAHARFVANVMAKVIGVTPTVVVHHDPAAGERITQFTNGRAPWLIAVRMVSEGVDIPRARVLCYCSSILTETFFQQMVGRVVRSRDGVVAPAYVVFPDDPQLREFASSIEEDVHSVRRVDPLLLGRHAGHDEAATASRTGAAGGALSPALNVVAVEHAESGAIIGDTAAKIMRDYERRAAPATIVRVPGPPPAHLRPAAAAGSPGSALAPTLRALDRAELREECNRLAKQVAGHFRVEVKAVHGLLGKRDGVTLDRASVEQLQARLRTLRTWMKANFFPK